jgi:Leucine-rich repeat (LRR) protein
VGSLLDLWMLNLKHNKLTSLPPAAGNLRKLMWLDISGNAIVHLPLGKRPKLVGDVHSSL